MGMTLEEAIKHCEEVAEKYDTELNLINCGISNESCDNCLECAAEHRQLAEWLTELKEMRRKPEPRLVNYESDGDADGYPVYDYARCPNCDHWFEDSDDSWEANYCPYCGQALEWEVNADD